MTNNTNCNKESPDTAASLLDADDIAYQNKDVASKVTGEALRGHSLTPFGLPHIKIRDVLPTNLPAIESNELRLDNLFLLEDEAIAIIDYESDYRQENFVKYLNYAARVVKRFAVQKRLPQLKKLRIIVIYTADVETASMEYDLEGILVRVEPAFLVSLDTEAIKKKLEEKLDRKETLTMEDQMQLMVLPLTVKGDVRKQKLILETVNLAKKIRDQKQKNQVLAGILTFTDKIIDEDYRKRIKEEWEMTQIGKMIFDDGFLAGEKRGRELGKELGMDQKLVEQSCRKLRKGKTPEIIALELEEDLERIQGICEAASGFAPEYNFDQVFEAWNSNAVNP
mgnify:CR=1 FL=1